jgi:hypothetical protein
MLDSVADKDGKAAWNKFLARWNSVSISTTRAGLEQLLDHHPKNASKAQQHVATDWEGRPYHRKLKKWKVPLSELPALESMLFLRTLPAKYNDFINHKNLQADELKDVPELCASAAAWSASVDRDSDEANTSGKAMWLGGGGGGSSDGNPPRRIWRPKQAREDTVLQLQGDRTPPERVPVEVRPVCGRRGHQKSDCYSTQHDKGRVLRSPLQVST